MHKFDDSHHFKGQMCLYAHALPCFKDQMILSVIFTPEHVTEPLILYASFPPEFPPFSKPWTLIRCPRSTGNSNSLSASRDRVCVIPIIPLFIIY